MTDFTANITKPGLVGVAPIYGTCTAADKFAAVNGAKYHLHYKNLATPTGALKVTDQVSNAQAPSGAVLAGGWADAQVTASLAAASELDVWIDTSLRFRDGQGFINLTHVTPTSLTVAIEGPF